MLFIQLSFAKNNLWAIFGEEKFQLNRPVRRVRRRPRRDVLREGGQEHLRKGLRGGCCSYPERPVHIQHQIHHKRPAAAVGSFAPLSVSAAPSIPQNTIFAESTSYVCSLQKYRKKCSVCGEYIQGSFYTKDDKFICAKDYKVRRKK